VPTGTEISESSLLNTPCNVLSVPTTIWSWIRLSELIRSAHCRSMRRWTLSGYMALIRSSSLTRSYMRISVRGICVLWVNKVAETWKVPSEAANRCSNSASAEDGYRLFRAPIVYLVTTPASRLHQRSSLFIPPTVSFEANHQFIKIFYRIRTLRKAPAFHL
jgi:hypothetical protein